MIITPMVSRVRLIDFIAGFFKYKIKPSWSGWRDLNPRPPGPEPGALPTALHPDDPNLPLNRSLAYLPFVLDAIKR